MSKLRRSNVQDGDYSILYNWTFSEGRSLTSHYTHTHGNWGDGYVKIFMKKYIQMSVWNLLILLLFWDYFGDYFFIWNVNVGYFSYE